MKNPVPSRGDAITHCSWQRKWLKSDFFFSQCRVSEPHPFGVTSKKKKTFANSFWHLHPKWSRLPSNSIVQWVRWIVLRHEHVCAKDCETRWRACARCQEQDSQFKNLRHINIFKYSSGIKTKQNCSCSQSIGKKDAKCSRLPNPSVCVSALFVWVRSG